MTDKEKIRAEIEMIRKSYQIKYQELDCTSPEIMSVCAKRNLCQDILFFIDSMQEETVSEMDFEQELYKYFGQVKDFTLGMRIAKRFYEIGRNYQEPVSEDLEQAIDNYLATYWGGEKEKKDWPFLKKMAIRFAEWQKQKDNNDANHALVEQIKTQQMWYEKGMADMKQQLMAKAIDATVHSDAGGYPCIPQMELYDYEKDIPLAKEGDKYNVILIKE